MVAGDNEEVEGRKSQANSRMFPKEARPPYLQDDEYFDSFKPEVALQAVMSWGQTMAVQKSEHSEGEQSGKDEQREEEYQRQDGGGESWEG